MAVPEITWSARKRIEIRACSPPTRAMAVKNKLPGFRDRLDVGERSGRLAGVVTDLAEAPVTNAEVYLYRSANTRRPADYISPRTGSDGAYRLVVPAGNYWGVARIKEGERFGPLQAGHGAQERGLARAVGADEGDDLPLVDVEGDVAQREPLAVGHVEVADPQHSSSPRYTRRVAASRPRRVAVSPRRSLAASLIPFQFAGRSGSSIRI